MELSEITSEDDDRNDSSEIFDDQAENYGKIA
jgi:hypothetical protein